MKVNTCELNGAALDWAVANCEGFIPFSDGISWLIDSGRYMQLPKYCSDWAYGGPIIERESISVTKHADQSYWWAGAWDARHTASGPTPLIAAMRCYVSCKLGNEVNVPDQLAKKSASHET